MTKREIVQEINATKKALGLKEERPDKLEKCTKVFLEGKLETLKNELAKAQMEMIPNLDCLDYQSLFLMGNKVNIIFGDGSERLAESVDDIANLDGLAMFEVVED